MILDRLLQRALDLKLETGFAIDNDFNFTLIVRKFEDNKATENSQGVQI